MGLDVCAPPGVVAGPADAADLGSGRVADWHLMNGLARLQAHQPHHAVAPSHREKLA